MKTGLRTRTSVAALVLAMGALVAAQQPSQDSQAGTDDGRFRFRAGVDLVNVAVTVTDDSGHFVTGLRQDDFTVYEDDQPQPITHFSAERVPVSLGIALDTSGSMEGEKFEHAQQALGRFLSDLLDPTDEVFLIRFSNSPVLVEDWTTEHGRISQALRRIVPHGGTAMYDAVAQGVPMMRQATNRKKALLIISDGNDTSSETPLVDVRQMIRESEALVYAVGIDGRAEMMPGTGTWNPPTRPRFPPFPFPGGSGGIGRPRYPPRQQGPFGRPGRTFGQLDQGVNVAALRALTDDSGGRTEIIRTGSDLDPATAGIADELSRQYFLAYEGAAHKDGRWHTIRVEVKDGRYQVRARRGYTAT